MIHLSEEEFSTLINEIVAAYNKHVFPIIDQRLRENENLRSHINSVFPFPRKLRIGLLAKHLVIEYIGPNDESSVDFDTEGTYLPLSSVTDFLGIDLSQSTAPMVAWETHLENAQFFVGDAMSVLSDYLYDIVLNPVMLVLNGFPDLNSVTSWTYLSNVAFLWCDDKGSLQIRRVDFMEIIPNAHDTWGFQTDESLKRFANFVLTNRAAKYDIKLHEVLNEFIILIKKDEITEPEITRFLASHPEILQYAFGVDELNPESELIWQTDCCKPNLRPDFMPIKMDGFADILEFKLPHLKGSPVVGSTVRKRPSAEVEAAIAQIDEYSEWCSQDINRSWLEANRGISVLSPQLYLVIGQSKDFSSEDRQSFRKRRNVTIFTYDEFIAMARLQLYRIR